LRPPLPPDCSEEEKKGAVLKSSPLSCRLFFGTPSLRENELLKSTRYTPRTMKQKIPSQESELALGAPHEEILHKFYVEGGTCDPFGYPQFAMKIGRTQSTSGTVWITMVYQCLACGDFTGEFRDLVVHVGEHLDFRHKNLFRRLHPTHHISKKKQNRVYEG
jgi:hypothetical protein